MTGHTQRSTLDHGDRMASDLTMQRIVLLDDVVTVPVDIAVVGPPSLRDRLDVDGLSVRSLTMGFLVAQVRELTPRYLVVDEEFVTAGPWSRWVDSFGTARGPLLEASLECRSHGGQVMVIARTPRERPLVLRHAQYIPNLRLVRELDSSEVPDLALTALASAALHPTVTP